MNELNEIGERLRTQDNRSTADPIFCVEQLRKDVCPEGYEDGRNWVDMESGDYGHATEEEAAKLDETGTDHDGIWEKHCYKERWEFVQPFLTESAAQAYIDCNGHNLSKTRIYVISAFRNLEWQAVRNSLKEGGL